MINILLTKSWLWRCPFKVSGFLALAFFFAAAGFARADDSMADNQRSASDSADPYISPTNGLGSWIWTDKTFDGQTCQLWRTFEVPDSSAITNARLVMTVDNEFTLYLDGRELGRGAEWRELFVFDLTRLLTPGKHVLAVKAVNSFGFAAMLFGLQVDLADGRVIEVQSDKSWRIVPDEVRHWKKNSRRRPTGRRRPS